MRQGMANVVEKGVSIAMSTNEKGNI